MPAHDLKAGSCFASFQCFESRIERANLSESSAEKKSDLRHLASKAGGIVGSSVYSAGRGWPTGSAGLFGSSGNADSRSQHISSSKLGLCAFAIAFDGLVACTISATFDGVVRLPSALGFGGRAGSGEIVPMILGRVGGFCNSPLRGCLEALLRSRSRPFCLSLPLSLSLAVSTRSLSLRSRSRLLVPMPGRG